MKVIDAAPRSWYLLEGPSGLILTVGCSHSFVGYDFTMELNQEEVAKYERTGRPFIDELANAIDFSVPIARGSASIYKNRNIDAQHSDAILEAVRQWKEEGHDA